MGITKRPPTRSCFKSTWGMAGPPAATTMASNGDSFEQPSVPSAQITRTLS